MNIPLNILLLSNSWFVKYFLEYSKKYYINQLSIIPRAFPGIFLLMQLFEVISF